jgi:hypothetical protein
LDINRSKNVGIRFKLRLDLANHRRRPEARVGGEN